MRRKAEIWVLALALSIALSFGCAFMSGGCAFTSGGRKSKSRTKRKPSRKKKVSKKSGTPRKSAPRSSRASYAKKSRTGPPARKPRIPKPLPKRKPGKEPGKEPSKKPIEKPIEKPSEKPIEKPRETLLAEVEEPRKAEPPEVKKPEPPAPRPRQISTEEEIKALAERRSRIEECELIPIPRKRDFWLTTYYMTGELIAPEDKRTPMEKREPHQAVIQIRLESRVPVCYFNGARVKGGDQLEVKLIEFRKDVIAERRGNKYMKPQVIIDADWHAPRKAFEVVYNRCFWAHIDNIQSVIRPRR